MSGTSATPSTPMNKAATGPVESVHGPRQRHGVMLAYSHRDRDLLGELQVHLKPLQKAWMLDLWDDLRVDGGARGHVELARAVASCRVVLLLLSPGFAASPFFHAHALPVLLATQDHPRAQVMCLYLRPSMDVFADFKYDDPRTGEPRSVRLTTFRGLNDPTRPLAALDKPARHALLAEAAAEVISAAHRGGAAVGTSY
jgi:hypothetical protein